MNPTSEQPTMIEMGLTPTIAREWDNPLLTLAEHQVYEGEHRARLIRWGQLPAWATYPQMRYAVHPEVVYAGL